MTGKTVPDRINFQVTPEFYEAVREAAGSQRISAFVRQAVEEKLGRIDTNDPQANTLLNLYGQLNERGKAWLIECASLATGSSVMKIKDA